ncbi:hypothetical protein BDB01DRAFT_771145 [Pilobolus umbonatus]|nr:hypothetical protein BDB01DRAFT_771145 [Pilobolus umbonatus]
MKRINKMKLLLSDLKESRLFRLLKGSNKKEYSPWTHLSPHELPIPSIDQPLVEEYTTYPVYPGSIPMTENTCPSNCLSCVCDQFNANRQLYTISETSEYSNILSMVSCHGSSSIISSDSLHSIHSFCNTPITIALNEPIGSDSMYGRMLSSIVVNDQKDKSHPTPVYNSNENGPINDECQIKNVNPTTANKENNRNYHGLPSFKFIPMYEWSNYEPILESPLVTDAHSEDECKEIFFHLVKSAHDSKITQNAYSPLALNLVFDDHGNINNLVYTTKKESHNFMKLAGPSIQYIPPELSRSSIYYQEMSDVWTLGITLYRMLVGKYPFDTLASDEQLFKSMLRLNIQIPTSLSEDARDLIKRALSPMESRASLDLILYHPWLKPYNHGLSLKSDGIRQPSTHITDKPPTCFDSFKKLTHSIFCHASYAKEGLMTYIT